MDGKGRTTKLKKKMNTTEDLIVEGNVTDDPNLLTDFDLHFIFKTIVHIRIL